MSANLENSELVVDPSKQVPGFDFKRHTWTQLNRIRTGHGRCNQTLHQWGATDDPACDCGFAVQDVHHVTAECQLRKMPGDLKQLHNLEPSALQWLNDLYLIL